MPNPLSQIFLLSPHFPPFFFLSLPHQHSSRWSWNKMARKKETKCYHICPWSSVELKIVGELSSCVPWSKNGAEIVRLFHCEFMCDLFPRLPHGTKRTRLPLPKVTPGLSTPFPLSYTPDSFLSFRPLVTSGSVPLPSSFPTCHSNLNGIPKSCDATFHTNLITLLRRVFQSE